MFVEEKWLVTGAVNTLAGWQVTVSYVCVCSRKEASWIELELNVVRVVTVWQKSNMEARLQL